MPIIVAAWSFFRGRSGCVWSSAWIWLFSSTHRTRALSGGLISEIGPDLSQFKTAKHF